MDLKNFLVNAKRSTYASNGEDILIYEQGDLRYADNYYGFNPFIGEELVWENEKIIWGMNYFGKAKHGLDVSVEEIYSNLKKALLKIPEEAPFRGPDHLKLNDSLVYFNEYHGDINSFVGEEKILLKGFIVYNLVYHGGLVKPKNAGN